MPKYRRCTDRILPYPMRGGENGMVEYTAGSWGEDLLKWEVTYCIRSSLQHTIATFQNSLCHRVNSAFLLLQTFLYQCTSILMQIWYFATKWWIYSTVNLLTGCSQPANDMKRKFHAKSLQKLWTNFNKTKPQKSSFIKRVLLSLVMREQKIKQR